VRDTLFPEGDREPSQSNPVVEASNKLLRMVSSRIQTVPDASSQSSSAGQSQTQGKHQIQHAPVPSFSVPLESQQTKSKIFAQTQTHSHGVGLLRGIAIKRQFSWSTADETEDGSELGSTFSPAASHSRSISRPQSALPLSPLTLRRVPSDHSSELVSVLGEEEAAVTEGEKPNPDRVGQGGRKVCNCE